MGSMVLDFVERGMLRDLGLVVGRGECDDVVRQQVFHILYRSAATSRG
jgi:hypothetical protein